MAITVNTRTAKLRLTLAVCALLASSSPWAADWSVNEIHLQKGDLKQTATNRGERDTTIITFQHASGWKYGDNFFFIDYLDYEKKDPGTTDGDEFYGEWYPNFSIGKMTGKEIKFGLVKDIGITLGFNFAPEVDSWWFLPGVRFDLDIPGFAFSNLLISGYENHSNADDSATDFVIFDEGSSYMVDFSFAYPFKIGSTNWTVEGHVEYIDGRSQRNTFGNTKLKSHVLAQPQIRMDLGEVLFDMKETFYVGIEYQYWRNKLGEDGLRDNTAQLLAVWRL